ncbi:LPS export ABC transporter periplasmic protein LptC [Pectinatus frisingensis]|uniref:LPS export ABC transporter periplasmic protein LptC n=1 Tax=Pectinatus frisingensis TaxID=865 RepID=UPI003D801173
MKSLKDKNKIALYGFIVIIIAVCVWAVVTKPEPQKKAADDTNKEETMDYMSNTIVEERNGRKIWEITADSIKMNTKTQQAEMENIHGKYYGENDGEQVLTLTAPHGTYSDSTKDIVLDNGVHVQGNQGLVFDAQKLVWDDENQLLTGQGNVKIVKDNMQAQADQVESSNSFLQFKLSGNAHIVEGSTAQ